jgi:regulation of enolase protein 1 (concanavalin A-like superfamily)
MKIRQTEQPMTQHQNSAGLPDFVWLNEPASVTHRPDGLTFVTRANTDFWQRTHYGFRRDDGHFYHTTSDDDFSLSATFRFTARAQYDQCGLMARVDAENWIKCSIEYEDERLSRLGSVVTNLGYSDWATQEIGSDSAVIAYRMQRRGADFLLEHSLDGARFAQMRVAHLHQGQGRILIGVYACSPKRAGFECSCENIAIGESAWRA